ncbi:hypothetical protein DL89DRAFT_34311 [Linderina pennispora]|uniref:Uncharacterized protein n=1 Tax=Linderina pennispora TaxID=61395 RepID=A0A1Y1VTI5_9FUNG|nr:uncharacterized protein DL89DRAFT_34311 [Linderina pennispora]ORX64326.1 hypothetical protein DL89DRAFT_34311 [Linderina pennispora]
MLCTKLALYITNILIKYSQELYLQIQFVVYAFCGANHMLAIRHTPFPSHSVDQFGSQRVLLFLCTAAHFHTRSALHCIRPHLPTLYIYDPHTQGPSCAIIFSSPIHSALHISALPNPVLPIINASCRALAMQACLSESQLLLGRHGAEPIHRAGGTGGASNYEHVVHNIDSM